MKLTWMDGIDRMARGTGRIERRERTEETENSVSLLTKLRLYRRKPFGNHLSDMSPPPPFILFILAIDVDSSCLHRG